MRTRRLLATTFLMTLGIFLFLKALNEISDNAVDYYDNSNEFLLIVTVIGVAYYLFLRWSTNSPDSLEDVFKIDFHLDVSKRRRLLWSGFASLVIFYIITLKTIFWPAGIFVSTLFSIFTFCIVFLSLKDN